MKKKVIKAWAIMDDKNRRIVQVLVGAKCPKVFYLASWGPFPVNNSICRPVEINLLPSKPSPSKRTKKK